MITRMKSEHIELEKMNGWLNQEKYKIMVTA